MKIDKQDFRQLVAKAMIDKDQQFVRPVIEKELLHYDILFALDDSNLLQDLTFQGGTSLRLCYGSSRYSEDLDFAGGLGFDVTDLALMKECLEDYIGGRYGLDVYVKDPKSLTDQNKNINVNHWQIRVTTAPKRADLPKQMIKIEVANIPAYTRKIRRINLNYDFLPDGYNDVLIAAESLDEILADKIIALGASLKYVRYRDIWDLDWLLKQNASYNIEHVRQKITDYKIKDYQEKLKGLIRNLPEFINSKAFSNQMQRFLPTSVLQRTLHKNNYRIYLIDALSELFRDVYAQL